MSLSKIGVIGAGLRGKGIAENPLPISAPTHGKVINHDNAG
jgi:3-hydroxyacyl-CoA dehydrogenase